LIVVKPVETRSADPRSEPERDNNSAELVFAYLRNRIMSGDLAVGSRLPPERELAAQLDISRPILREALRALSMIGVVDIRHGAGTVVRRPDASALGHFFTFAMAHEVPVAEEVMEGRIAVECQAGRLACARATTTDIDSLRTALEEIEKTVNDPQTGAAADHAFHLALVAAAHAPVLSAMYAALAELLFRTHVYRRRTVPLTDEFLTYLVEDHRRILVSLADRDVESLDAVLRRHFAIGNEFRDQATRQEILRLWST
jgi:GntR family transcriptional regulator, transcriptional repressor for pyruvate dehydrogenase complex